MKRALIALALVAALPAAARVRVPDWVEAAAADTPPKYGDKIHAVVLLDDENASANANGEIRTVRRVVTKILSTSGRDYGVVYVSFGGNVKLKGLRAWSIAADGQQYQVGERDATETAAFDGELYADQKIKILRIPASEPGSVVAYEYEVVGTPYGIQDVWRFQSSIPVRRARYSIALPEGWEYQTHWVNAEKLEPQRAGANLTWEMRDVPAVEPELGAPNVSASAGYMGISFIPPSGAGHRTWDDVARWYDGLAEQRRAVTPAIEAKAKALTANLSTPYEKAMALAKFAQRDVRYVAIAIGIGGYQPHAADAVLSTLYGDCKDKVTLLSAMLRAVGIESRYVLVNSERGYVDERFPSLYGFNHVIIAVKIPEGAPKQLHASANGLLYFDPTHPHLPLGWLPTSLQGSRGLLTGNGKGELVVLPSHPPEASKLLRTAKLTLQEDGSLQGRVEEVRTGALAASFRSSLSAMNEKERQQLIDYMMAYHLTQHSVKDLVIENADDPAKDLVVKYTITAPRYARTAGGLLLLRPRVLGTKPEPLLDLTERKREYLTDGPSQQIDDIEIALPAQLQSDELPPPRKVTTAAVTYTSESAVEQNTLRYKRRYEVHQHVVPRDKLAELNKAFSEILADERTSAVLK
jgi:Domain of Unknown Function with PDB structure (DUF3857)/Transglutaminase-like superfamily